MKHSPTNVGLAVREYNIAHSCGGIVKNYLRLIYVWLFTRDLLVTRRNVLTETGAACLEYCALVGCCLCAMVGITSASRHVGYTFDLLGQLLGGGSISSDADGLAGCQGKKWLNGACESDDNTDNSDETDNAGQP